MLMDTLGQLASLANRFLPKNGEPPNEGALQSLVGLAHDQLRREYMPYINTAPTVAELIGKDVAPIAVALIGFFTEIADDDGVKEAVQTFTNARARSRKVALEAYLAAGFTREEAMPLLLADIAQIQMAASKIGSSVGSNISGNVPTAVAPRKKVKKAA